MARRPNMERMLRVAIRWHNTTDIGHALLR